MSFLSPWFLLGALAVVAPIVFHLRRKDVAPALDFSAVRFLRRAPVEQRRPRHLKDLLLLLLRAAALVLLALAFARPYFTGETAVAGTTVVAVDTSFSMSAPGRFDRAREAAQRAVASAPAGDRVAVVRFDDHAAIVAQPSLDRGAARAAIGSLAPGYGATRYGAALAVAARAIGPEGGRLVLVTDLQDGGRAAAGALGTVSDNVELSVADVGEALENLSLARVKVEGEGVSALVTNHGVKPRATSVNLWLNDRSVAEAKPTIAPGSTLVPLIARLPTSGSVRVTLTDDEGPAADNERFLVLDAPPAPGVLLLGEEPKGDDLFYLRAAFEAADGPRRVTVEALNAGDREALTDASARERQAIVVVGTRSMPRPARTALAGYLEQGGAMMVTAGDALDAGTLAEILGTTAVRVEAPPPQAFPTTIAPVDQRHPIFAAFGDAASNLGEARFTGGVRIVPGPGGRVVARFTNGLPALVEQPVGAGRVLLFASDLSGVWNTFPRQASFVPFVLEALRYLSGLRAQPGEMLVADVPAGTAARPGVVRLGTPPRPVAVNVDGHESSTARVSGQELTAAIRRVSAQARSGDAQAREREASQHLWRWLLVATALFLIAEALLGNRTRAATAPVDAPSEGIRVQP